jgi:hypothetical protein
MKLNRRSLYWKLTLAFILVSFIATAMAAIFVRVTSTDRLAQLIFDQQRASMLLSLENYYAATGSWTGVSTTWDEMQKQTFPTPYPPPPNETPRPTPDPQKIDSGREKRNLFGLAGTDGVVIIAVDQENPAGSKLLVDQIAASTAIEVNGKGLY